MGELRLLSEVRRHRGPVQNLVTKVEIAAHFRVDVRTITRWMGRGMPFDRPYEHGAVRFVVAECEAWTRRHRRKR